MDNDKEDDDRMDLDEHKPKIFKPSTPYDLPDPVRANKKGKLVKKHPQIIEAKTSIISAKIEPTLSTRIGLQFVREGLYKEGDPRPKYIFPRTKKQQKFFEDNRAYTSKKFCQYTTSEVPKPFPKRTLQTKLQVASPEASKAKVTPRRVTPTPSNLYPYPQTASELALKKPKSGIFINVTGEKDTTDEDYDSFDLVYSRKARPDGKPGKRKKAKKKGKLDDITEEDEESSKKRKKRKRKREKSPEIQEAELVIEQEEAAYDQAEEGHPDMLALQDYLMKQFRRKVSQISAATSYQSKDYATSVEQEVTEYVYAPIDKFIQKFRRESEAQQHKPRKRKIKRGTLQSHSFTNINQPILKDFFFGCRIGTMHQGDESFAPNIRNIQGICMPVAAYCFSIFKHPNRWTTEDVDRVLEYGNTLCVQSIETCHKHDEKKELKPEELRKYCIIGDKKIRFTVEDPDIVGYTRSDDKTVYNLSKGLRIFFYRNTSGILKTQDFNIAIWKDKYFYIFDAKARTKDLYTSSNGVALMANFYDTTALASVFLDRSNFGNWPFVIYPIKAFKILNRDDLEVDSNVALEVDSNYKVLNEKKAVCLGSFDLADKCFDFSRNKQSLTMAVMSLVYSKITPSSAWRKTTVDKIMILGNQLFLECSHCENNDDIRLDNLPALFTVGPYVVEIYIYANIIADMLFKLCCCQLNCSLEDFFFKGTNAIVQIGKSKHIAIWKQRDMYYCFDPYSRDGEGFQCRSGTACVTMHSDLESLVNTVAVNFDTDSVFYIHALKVCKIDRDPMQSSRFPKHLPMDEFPVEEFKKYRMKKSKKSAVEKPISVDYTALAMIRMLAGDEMRSIHEIGSTVESLNMDTCLSVFPRRPSKTILKTTPKITDVVADLDSPSLSDTQIPPQPAPELRASVDEVEFLDLDSFELTMEEIELAEVAPEEEGGEGGRKRKWYGGEDEEEGEGLFDVMEGEEEYYEGEDDWYYAMSQFAQAEIEREPSKIEEEMNTEITYFPIKKEVLYPTYVRGKQQMKYRLQKYKFTDDDWDTYLPPDPAVTQSQELRKETNFVTLPDNTEIIHGTKNVADFGKDIEFIAPFICIMAGVVSRKYSILSWSNEIIDYVLKCGKELYSASKFRYDQVSKLEIPKITLGDMSFTVLVDYIFDTYTRQNILELAIDKILFVRSDVGVLVTPVYACALFYKNHLYYMYDCFGNNEVGLSEGPINTGTACFSRFKDVRSLAARIMYNKKKRESDETIVYSKFVLSTIRVKQIPMEKEEKEKKPKPKKKSPEYTDKDGEEGDLDVIDEKDELEGTKQDTAGEEEGQDKAKEGQKQKDSKNKIGYRYKNKNYVLEGTKSLQGRKSMSSELKADHFVCLVASLMLMTCPVESWDTKKVDEALDSGKHVYNHADDLDISQKRTIKNMLVGKYFFDVIVRKLKIENWRDRETLSKSMDTILGRKLSYFLIQFPNACYLVHKSNDRYHLFNPYPDKTSPKAHWLLCGDVKKLKRKLKRLVVPGGESFHFYNFEVTSIQKAPKDILMNYKLMQYDIEPDEKKEKLGKPFYEDVEWLKKDPIPWSRKVNRSPEGNERGKIENMWHYWDIEYPRDLFSLMGNTHQISLRFSDDTRGKQTLANLVVAIGMTEIYDLTEWNSAVVDSVLVNGNIYFLECIKDIKEENYEISIDDLKSECSIFPFSFNVSFNPIVEGTMFLVRVTQFNLYKALRYFFNNIERRCGIICSNKSENKRQIAFGKLQDSEYFMFDSECIGAPMFLEGCGVAYVLRMTTLNRLLHVITLTLRGGDFYIYEVEITDLKPIS